MSRRGDETPRVAMEEAAGDPRLEGTLVDVGEPLERPDEPPEILPLFPLTGVLLLPGGRLPLHVFEERYRNLLDDVLAEHGCVGLVQPEMPNPGDLRGETSRERDEGPPPLYEIGCVGWVEYHRRLPEGRSVILLRGWRRFRILREIEPIRGYRRAEVDSEAFRADEDPPEVEIRSEDLVRALREFGRDHRVEIEIDDLTEIPGLDLLNSLAMALPFLPAEKQALLEAEDVEARQEMLFTLLEMGLSLDAVEGAGDADGAN